MVQYSQSAIGIDTNPSNPTVIMFHGWGANMFDLLDLSSSFPSNWNWRFIQAPVYLGNQSYGWFPKDLSIFQSNDPLSYFLNLPESFIDELFEIKKYLEDQFKQIPEVTGPLLVGGFSQGAMISLACKFEIQIFNTIDGILAFSPTSWTHLESIIISANQSEPNKTPIIISHGYHDPILPFDKTKALVKLMETKLYPVHFLPFSGYHEIPRSILRTVASLFKDLKAD